MIRVSNLTKRFGRTTAVDNLSFHVARGEIVGFLGPNGAGKTTTMRILSCFLPPTGGTVQIAGLDIFHESVEARRHIGYMPEHVPMYTDMRVQEFLAFRGRLKGLRGKRLRGRVDEMCEACGLTDMRRRLIGMLSKGYRQRVGLADSLLHEPDLLILDEPTIGLDPNQIRHIRTLIKSLAERHTVLLSSHILTEIESVCQRVLIMDGGQIVASDTPQNLVGLMKGHGQVTVEIRGHCPEIYETIHALPKVERVAYDRPGEWTLFTVESERGVDIRLDLFKLAVAKGWDVRELHEKPKNLEDVFVEITASDDADIDVSGEGET